MIFFLLDMASAKGHPIKVDINTLKVKREKFPHIYVEVDITKSVAKKSKKYMVAMATLTKIVT